MTPTKYARSASKKILECAEYDAIRKVVSQLKAMLWANVVPGVQFIKGERHSPDSDRINDADGMS